jgi:hypothetical protein
MIKNVVLDLDETLVHSEIYNGSIRPGLRYHFFENYIIYERPHLDRFIFTLATRYRLSVWTAAHKAYAAFILKVISGYLPPRTSFLVFMHSEHCSVSKRDYGVLKHLNLLFSYKAGFTKANTVLLDDNPGVLVQPNRVLQVYPFTGDFRDDDLLLILDLF